MAEPATVDDLAHGDHACLTFSDADERLDIVAAFVRDGLEQGDKVVCLTDALAPDELTSELGSRGLPVANSVATGQLEVAPSVSMYVSSGAFDATEVIDGWRARIDGARSAGYPGLRITADMRWALRPVNGLEQLITCETQFNRLIAAGGVTTVVCQYDRQGFDAVTLASITAAHANVVTAVTYHNDAVLRISRQHIPPGVRIAGELDFRGLESLTNALGEAVRLDEHVLLNMTQLRFIDVAAAAAVLQTALGLPDGRRMTIVCRQPVGKVLRALGGDRLSSLRLVVRDVR